MFGRKPETLSHKVHEERVSFNFMNTGSTVRCLGLEFPLDYLIDM